MRRALDSACVGRLPAPVPHDRDVNTERLCIRGAADDPNWPEPGKVFDLQINKSDRFWFRMLLDALDQRKTDGA